MPTTFTTTYIIAQIFGILALVACFASPMFKKKWQIFLVAIFSNLFVGLNYVLLGEIVPGLMTLFGIGQCALCIYHTLRDKPIPALETSAFTLLGIVMSFASIIANWTGIFVAGAVVSYNVSVAVKKEQMVRLFLLINYGSWLAYDVLIGAAALLSHGVGFISTSIALISYMIKERTKNTQSV